MFHRDKNELNSVMFFQKKYFLGVRNFRQLGNILF